MEARKPATLALTIPAISIMRPEPIVAMGLLSMLVQGTLFGLLFPAFDRGPSTIRSAVLFSWALGAFLASYIVSAEAGKYAIPSIPSWIAVEAGASAIQFTVFGILLGWIHRGGAPRVGGPPVAD